MRKCKKWTGPNRTSRYARAAPEKPACTLLARCHDPKQQFTARLHAYTLFKLEQKLITYEYIMRIDCESIRIEPIRIQPIHLQRWFECELQVDWKILHDHFIILRVN